MSNATALLVIYDTIRSGKPCRIRDLMELTNCSRRTCFRYIRYINEHLEEKGDPHRLQYDAKRKQYLLVNRDNKKGS